MCGVSQFELDLVGTRRQSDEDHGFATRVDDGPCLPIYVVVQVSNSRRNL